MILKEAKDNTHDMDYIVDTLWGLEVIEEQALMTY